jgi:hypothetical protein
MSRKSKHNDGAMIKALNPKDPDTKYTGEEPFFAVQPDPEFRNSALARSFSWYTRYYGRKEGKELYIQYLELNDRKADAKINGKSSRQRNSHYIVLVSTYDITWSTIE